MRSLIHCAKVGGYISFHFIAKRVAKAITLLTLWFRLVAYSGTPNVIGEGSIGV